MAERTVEVRLKAAVAGYVAAMNQASAATRQLGRDVEQTARSSKSQMTQVGMALGTVGAAVSAGVGIAIKSFADFDRQMSAVGAVADATAGEMDQLREAALKAGASTVFSASESALAIEELVKAGVSVQDVVGGALAGALDLAAAGGLELADAAVISAQAMKTFKLEGSDVVHIADVLAAGANKSAADVADLGAALRQGGLVAAQVGLSLEETSAALAAFSDRALIGSDAGTSLKTMLQRLTPQSDEAARLMNELGFSAFDAGGEFVGLEGLAGRLRDSLADMTVEQRNATMATLFGTDAVRAATVLYEVGADGVRDYVEAVDDQAAAADMAAKKLDNLAGDLEELGGAVETALIGSGGAGNDILRELTQTATDAVRVFSALPDPVQEAAVVVGALAGAASLAGGAALVLIPKIAATKVAMAELGVTAGVTGTALRGIGGFLMGPWGVAVAAATTAVGLWASATADHEATVAKLSDTLDTNTGAVTEWTRSTVLKALSERDALQAARDLGISSSELIDTLLAGGPALDDLRTRLHRISDSYIDGRAATTEQIKAWSTQKTAAGALLGALFDLGDGLADAQERARMLAEETAKDEGRFVDFAHAIDQGVDPALARLAIAHQIAAAAAGEQAESQDGLRTETEETTSAVQRQAQVMRAQLDPVFGAVSALQNLRDAQEELTEAQNDTAVSAAELDEKEREVARRAVDARGALAGLRDENGDLVVSLDEVQSMMADLGVPPAVMAQMLADTGLVLDELKEIEGIDPIVVVSADISPLMNEIGRAQNAIYGIKDRTVRIRADFAGAGITTDAVARPTFPRGVVRHDGGPAAAIGPTRSMLDLAPGEVPIIAEEGGYVLPRHHVRMFDHPEATR